MRPADSQGIRLAQGESNVSQLLFRFRSLLFGDRLGVALFLGTLCWFGITWRLGFFITDSYAVANTLINVASGHLHIAEFEYSLTLGSQPGLHVHDGRVYGRNYGQVYAALPVYLVLQGVSVIADLRVATAGAFSLVLLGCAHQIGGVVDRRPLAVGVGSVLAVVSFGLSLAWATALPDRWAGLLALQVTTMLAGGVLAVALYRLGTAMYGRRIGLALGGAVVVATPIGFWASIPKRHVLTAALVAITVACFYASRGRTDRFGRRIRGAAYVAAGFTTAVHSVEGFVLLGVLFPVDLVTAPSNSRRDLSVVVLALLLGLAPFLLTNAFVSGNPLLAPRWLDSFDGGSIGPDGFVETGGDESDGGAAAPGRETMPTPAEQTTPTNGSSEQVTTAPPENRGSEQVTTPPSGDGSGGSGGLPGVTALLSLLSAVLAGASLAVDYAGSSLGTALEPDRLYHVFVRSGRIPGVRYGKNEQAIVELTLIESLPLAGVALLGVATGVRNRAAPWLRDVADRPRNALGDLWRSRTDPALATDLLVLGTTVGFTLVYLPKLPLFSQISARYLIPTVPLWLYLLARVRPVRHSVAAAPRTAALTYGVGVLVGTALVVGVLSVLDPALGEAMQFHALVNLGLAAVALACVTLGSRRPRVGAAGLALAAAGTTVFLALVGLVYFPYGPTLLPVADRVAELIAFV